jgi:hypothetical protein
VTTPNPYSNWSGAPKHWVHVPEQRQSPPPPEQLDAAAQELSAEPSRPTRGEWTVAAIALAVAVGAFVLIGTGGATTERETSPPERTNGTTVR